MFPGPTVFSEYHYLVCSINITVYYYAPRTY